MRTKRDFLVIRHDATVDLYTGDHAETQAADSVNEGDTIYAGRGIVEYALTSIRRLLPAEAPKPRKERKPRKARATQLPPEPGGDE
jgi:hypothetical protein